MDDLKALARSIFDHALQHCSIDRAFDRSLRSVVDQHGTRLLLQNQHSFALHPLRRVRILAAGKASAAMLTSLLARLQLPPSCSVEGVLIANSRPSSLPPGFQFFAGGHPTPNPASFAAAAAALAMLRAVAGSPPAETLCIFLLSGGASAMMELPLDPAISLDDTIAFHRALVHSGASIVEINCVRKHFSAVKGGRLALAAGAAQTLSLFVSDVPPAHLDALASGPTLPDPTTVADCRAILARHHLLDHFPPSIRNFFAASDLPESPKPTQLSPICLTVLDSDALAQLARNHAASLGFHAVIDNTCDDWSYDAAADYLLDRLRQLRREHPRVCLISAGEVTLQLPPEFSHAQGGRNQHFALYAATRVAPDDGPLAILSAGSDGIDGNSPAAGAVVDQHTVASPAGALPATRALEVFDSHCWLNTLRATLVTGPTGHNLRDLRILLAIPAEAQPDPASAPAPAPSR